MDNSFQTSFVPKKPVDDVIKKRHKIDLFTLVSVLVLILVILFSIVLYVYNVYLLKQKEALAISLQKSRDSFEQETIQNLESFNKRTLAVKDILSKHRVITPLFKTLEEITIPNIQYTNFSHEVSNDNMIVRMEGVAFDYKSIAQQSEIFNSNKGRFFKGVVFSDLIRSNTNNTISFKLEFGVDPSLLSYEKNLLINSENLIQN